MRYLSRFGLALCLSAVASSAAFAGASPVGNGFTYQGQLKQAGTPYNGTADLEFRLFETSGGITQVAGPLLVTNITVAQGVFTVDLDFGAAVFNGDERWLQIAVTTPSTNGAGPFTTLVPRQAVKPAPYALRALSLAGLQSNPVQFTSASNSFVGTHSGTGAGLTGLNATNIATGNLATTRMATGGSWSLSTDLNVDANSLVVDAAANAVGVGTASPLAPLHVQEGSAGAIAPHSNSSLVLERNNNNYLHMYAPDANESGFLFGGNTTDLGGAIIFNAGGAPDGLQFRTGGNNTRMVVDDVGQVGIGTTTPLAKLHVEGTSGVDGIMFPDGSLQVRAAKILRATVAQGDIIFPVGGTTLNLNVPGAVGGTAVSVSYGAELGNLIIAWTRVSAANNVQVRVFNPGGAGVLINASSWNVAILQ